MSTTLKIYIADFFMVFGIIVFIVGMVGLVLTLLERNDDENSD
jgi:hypothetical protein